MKLSWYVVWCCVAVSFMLIKHNKAAHEMAVLVRWGEAWSHYHRRNERRLSAIKIGERSWQLSTSFQLLRRARKRRFTSAARRPPLLWWHMAPARGLMRKGEPVAVERAAKARNLRNICPLTLFDFGIRWNSSNLTWNRGVSASWRISSTDTCPWNKRIKYQHRCPGNLSAWIQVCGAYIRDVDLSQIRKIW